MEETKFNWKRLLIIVAYVVVTAGVVGGVTWHAMDANQKKDQEQYEKQIRELEKQKNQEKTEAKEESTEETVKGNLLTYTNSKYNFTLKYPSAMFIRDGGINSEGIYSIYFIENKYKDFQGENPNVALRIYPKKATNLSIWIPNETTLDPIGSLKEVTIAGKQAYYFESYGMDEYENYALHGNNSVYAYIITAPKNYTGANLLDIANSIKFN